MNVTTVLSPAQKILTGAVLAAVAGTCFHAHVSPAGDSPAVAKKEVVVPVKKEVVEPFKKEAVPYTVAVGQLKKELTPLKKESSPLKKESSPLTLAD